MARLRTNVLKWGNKYDGPNDYKHGRRGALDDAFWDEDELVDYVGHRSKRKRPKKARGCPENDFGPHVYVRVTRTFPLWDGTIYRYEVSVCCGCERRK